MKCLILGLAMLSTAGAFADVTGHDVEYNVGGKTMQGYVAADSSWTGVHPLVLVFHDWDGIDDYEKGRCRQLAELGYLAFAVDIYGKTSRPGPGEAGKESAKYYSNNSLWRERAAGGLKAALAESHADKDHVAAIGYCFGGAGALELARSGAKLNAVVTFHGSLATSNQALPGQFYPKVLVLHGADDPFVPADQVANFETEMKTAKVEYRIVKYPGAVHAFTVPKAGNDNSKGAAYNAEADKKSWEEMKAFLAQTLGK